MKAVVKFLLMFSSCIAYLHSPLNTPKSVQVYMLMRQCTEGLDLGAFNCSMLAVSAPKLSTLCGCTLVRLILHCLYTSFNTSLKDRPTNLFLSLAGVCDARLV